MTDKYVRSVFKLIDTYGYPIEIALQEIDSFGMTVDWEDFIKDAIDHGWRYEQIRNKIKYACLEIYGPKFKKVLWKIQATYLYLTSKTK